MSGEWAGGLLLTLVEWSLRFRRPNASIDRILNLIRPRCLSKVTEREATSESWIIVKGCVDLCRRSSSGSGSLSMVPLLSEEAHCCNKKTTYTVGNSRVSSAALPLVGRRQTILPCQGKVPASALASSARSTRAVVDAHTEGQLNAPQLDLSHNLKHFSILEAPKMSVL